MIDEASLRTFHVDIVQNEWAAGKQRLLARIVSNGNLQVVESDDDDTWRDRLLVSRKNEFGSDLSPLVDQKAYLDQLVADMGDGTYLFATPIHTGEDCLFSSSAEVSMGTQGV